MIDWTRKCPTTQKKICKIIKYNHQIQDFCYFPSPLLLLIPRCKLSLLQLSFSVSRGALNAIVFKSTWIVSCLQRRFTYMFFFHYFFLFKHNFTIILFLNCKSVCLRFHHLVTFCCCCCFILALTIMPSSLLFNARKVIDLTEPTI